jgi:hypothetical protein
MSNEERHLNVFHRNHDEIPHFAGAPFGMTVRCDELQRLSIVMSNEERHLNVFHRNHDEIPHFASAPFGMTVRCDEFTMRFLISLALHSE